MPLALTVSLISLAVLLLIGAAAYLIDKDLDDHGGK
jgi:hypothetical protein